MQKRLFKTPKATGGPKSNCKATVCSLHVQYLNLDGVVATQQDESRPDRLWMYGALHAEALKGLEEASRDVGRVLCGGLEELRERADRHGERPRVGADR